MRSPFRLTIVPSPGNGLLAVSQVMIEKPVAIPRERLRDTIGKLEEHQMLTVTSALSLLFDIV